MVIVFFLFSLLIYISKKNNKYIPKFAISILGVLTLQIALLLIYRIELFQLGREVYYSDATTYWEATKAMLNGYDFHAWNLGYVYYSVIIQKTTPFVSVFWVNLSNLLLFDLSVVLIAFLMTKENKA